MSEIRIRDVSPDERAWVRVLIRERWGDESVVAHGARYVPHELAGLVAEREGERVGLITYRIAGGACEVVTVDSLHPGQGIGTALLDAVVSAAQDARCKRVWVITTNDNLEALRFYQKRGFVLVAVHPNALERSRQLKPQIPLVGAHGIPLRDEIELERALGEPTRGRHRVPGKWWKGLWTVSVAGCVGGIVLALLSALLPTVLPSVYRFVFDPGAAGALSTPDRVMLNVAFGIGGGLQAGACALIAYMALYPLRHGERWAWRACVIALALWLALDTGLTAWYVLNGYPRLWPKIANDLCFAIMFGLPYVGLYRYAHP